jgi:predicted GIY-YIG superfamily endonuclease
VTNGATHALYRFYDATGALLYIGITADPGSRWRSHAHNKPWWQQISTITVETHNDRAAVLRAEECAIRAELPKYNIVHNRSRPDATPARPRPEPIAASDMPDDCHDRCVPTGVDAIYYPYRWRDGCAHYLCDRGHHWTCWWGHSESGDAPENARVPAWQSRRAAIA